MLFPPQEQIPRLDPPQSILHTTDRKIFLKSEALLAPNAFLLKDKLRSLQGKPHRLACAPHTQHVVCDPTIRVLKPCLGCLLHPATRNHLEVPGCPMRVMPPLSLPPPALRL